MKKRISFNITVRGTDGPTAVRVSVSRLLLLRVASAAALLAVSICFIHLKRKKSVLPQFKR